MRIIVVGNGKVGKVIVRQLVHEGHNVVVFDNLERGHVEAVDKRAKLVRADLRRIGSHLNI